MTYLPGLLLIFAINLLIWLKRGSIMRKVWGQLYGRWVSWGEDKQGVERLLKQFVMCEWNEVRGQSIANVLWAAAMLEYRLSHQLIDAVLNRVEEVSSFSGRDLGMSVWALHKMRHYDQVLMRKLVDAGQIGYLSDADTAAILQAAAEFKFKNWQQLLDSLSISNLRSPQHTVNIIRALSIFPADISIVQRILDDIKLDLNPYQMSQIFYAWLSYKARGQDLKCDINYIKYGRQYRLQEIRKQIRSRGQASNLFHKQVFMILKKRRDSLLTIFFGLRFSV
eukprot:TRINITY_DN46426_c0_g1_i6.p1 TRINITY_DN46426_c0_g1~~TRINITY_DN46426_c0_g1_i6.p1  ORF type:complete len:280 (-),score=20.59 TRINITY_DN46426_c0_g1_i6:387-1226(-)